MPATTVFRANWIRSPEAGRSEDHRCRCRCSPCTCRSRWRSWSRWSRWSRWCSSSCRWWSGCSWTSSAETSAQETGQQRGHPRRACRDQRPRNHRQGKLRTSDISCVRTVLRVCTVSGQSASVAAVALTVRSRQQRPLRRVRLLVATVVRRVHRPRNPSGHRSLGLRLLHCTTPQQVLDCWSLARRLNKVLHLIIANHVSAYSSPPPSPRHLLTSNHTIRTSFGQFTRVVRAFHLPTTTLRRPRRRVWRRPPSAHIALSGCRAINQFVANEDFYLKIQHFLLQSSESTAINPDMHTHKSPSSAERFLFDSFAFNDDISSKSSIYPNSSPLLRL